MGICRKIPSMAGLSRCLRSAYYSYARLESAAITHCTAVVTATSVRIVHALHEFGAVSAVKPAFAPGCQQQQLEHAD